MKLYAIMPTINTYELTREAYLSFINQQLPEGITQHFILLDQASDQDEIKNWKNEFPESDYIRYSPRVALSKAWNDGIRKAIEEGADYIAVLNNDIVLHPKTMKHLISFMDKTGYLMVTADNIKDRMSLETMLQMELPMEYTDYDCETISDWRAEGPDFSCFMINPKTIEIVGWFDENFAGAYCEDQDYHVRIRRAYEHIKQHDDKGIEAERVHAKRLSTAPYYHYASQTLVRNTTLRHEISLQHGRNQSYYLRKWGGEHPFCMDGKGNTQPFGEAGKDWRDW